MFLAFWFLASGMFQIIAALANHIPNRTWAILSGVISLLLGLSHGVENGAGLAQTQSGLMGLAGIACAIFVVVALVTGHVASLRAAWARLVVRVAGSWIAAIGLLMLGWSLRPPVG